MLVDFKPFSKTVENKFKEMSKSGELFVTDISADELWEIYLDSYPEGTNELFRTRREYDCTCCRNFVKNIGNVVQILNNNIVTVWDVDNLPYPFDIVALKMGETIREHGKIKGVFRSRETSYGAEKTFEHGVGSWNHFNCSIATAHKSDEVAKIRGEFVTKAQVFERGLEELTRNAIDEVLDLIKSDSIYRGTEHLAAVEEFSKLHREYVKLNSQESKNLFVWSNLKSFVTGFRNTVIGSLVQDLSQGVDLETAVKKFESKVAPDNYKRSKSLITPAMIRDAMKTIDTLGLERALKRRFARISDVTVGNVLFVDNAVRGLMKGGLTSLLMQEAKTAVPDTKKAENISVTDFMENVLPSAKSVEAFVKNSMMNNFMSMTAPVHDEVERLFKWDNNFAWVYDGNLSDSSLIKEKVRSAGGNVTNAKMRVSLAWYNFDDLDIHVKEPNNNIIYYGNKDGKLDVDMNVSPQRRDAVENVSWRAVMDGIYKVEINNFSKRESIDVGCTVEVENNGNIITYNYEKVVGKGTPIIDITVKNGVISNIKMHSGVTGKEFSQEKWGVTTETFVPVDSITLSPNYWDENKVGNKHWFFILKNCVNPEPIRGIFNEYLRSDLDKHRKVFEILGDKTKCESTSDQISGIGFSSTKRDDLVVMVKGQNRKNKLYNIKF